MGGGVRTSRRPFPTGAWGSVGHTPGHHISVLSTRFRGKAAQGRAKALLGNKCLASGGGASEGSPRLQQSLRPMTRSPSEASEDAQTYRASWHLRCMPTAVPLH